MNIPIIFIHRGAHFYLENALRQASLFNPNIYIYILGDESNKHLEKDNIKHYLISDYQSSAKQFERKYIHMSSNGRSYELFCFLRWFIIKDFVDSLKIDTFFVADSDVLLYCNVSEELKNAASYDFTVCERIGPISTLMTKKSIQVFTDYMLSLYSGAEGMEKLKAFHETFFDEKGNRKRIGGVCDMTVFDFYQTYISDNVLDLAIPANGKCFDSNLRSPYGFQMKGSYKDIVWIDDKPYCKYVETGEMIRFCSIHFQGKAKYKQHKFLIDENGKHIENISSALRWTMFKALATKYWGELKNLKTSLRTYYFLHIKRP